MPRTSGPVVSTAPGGAPLDGPRFATAVHAALAEQDRSQADLARATGLSRSSVSRYLSGVLTPSREAAAKVLDALDLSWADVTRPGELTLLGRAMDTSDVVLLPNDGYASGARSAGEGYVNGDAEVVGVERPHHPYSQSELKRVTGLRPDGLRTCVVIGDSLAPDLPPGTRAVYFPLPEHAGDGLYVVAIDDGHVVKRVQRLADGTLRLIPYNPAYSEETLTPMKEADTDHLYRTGTGGTAVVRFVGKVVYYAKSA